MPGVVEALRLTGTWDCQLRLRVPEAAHIDEILRTVTRDVGAEQTQTRLVLRAALSTTPP